MESGRINRCHLDTDARASTADAPHCRSQSRQDRLSWKAGIRAGFLSELSGCSALPAATARSLSESVRPAVRVIQLLRCPDIGQVIGFRSEAHSGFVPSARSRLSGGRASRKRLARRGAGRRPHCSTQRPPAAGHTNSITVDRRRSRAGIPVPSRPGEFHPEPLTDPDLTLSRHPARATV